jgi:nitrogen fixation NifU-like protein
MSNGFNWMYSETVKDHFVNPRNVLEDEDSFQADGMGTVGNIKCGDQMLVAIKVENDKITDCKWKTYGCASAIASTSILSEMVKGMDLAEAYELRPEDITKKLEGLPDNKIHCSVLGDKALREAINDYYRRNGMGDKVVREKETIVCQCLNVTDKDIENAVKEKGIRTFEELQQATKISTGCGQCREDAEEILHQMVHLYGD